jgi:hypothetical protein
LLDIEELLVVYLRQVDHFGAGGGLTVAAVVVSAVNDCFKLTD